jgi:hypothetical protein
MLSTVVFKIINGKLERTVREIFPLCTKTEKCLYKKVHRNKTFCISENQICEDSLNIL